VQTAIETPAFLASAKETGIDDEERAQIVAAIASHPLAGDIIPGSGGARKVRFAARGKGKSGGYRLITFYAADDVPIFLLDVYAKSQRANLQRLI